MIGIYKIINRSNNKVYIGQSSNIANRKHQHWVKLLKRRHPNKYLQADFNKFKTYFAFELVEQCPLDKLNERELYWINYFNSTDRNCGYNISTTPFKRKKKK